MPAERTAEPGRYLAGLLASGVRPFGYRGGVHRLLGVPARPEGRAAFLPPLPPVGFRYEAQEWSGLPDAPSGEEAPTPRFSRGAAAPPRALPEPDPPYAGRPEPAPPAEEPDSTPALAPRPRPSGAPSPSVLRPAPPFDGGPRPVAPPPPGREVPRGTDVAAGPRPEEKPGARSAAPRGPTEPAAVEPSPSTEGSIGLTVPGTTERRTAFAALARHLSLPADAGGVPERGRSAPPGAEGDRAPDGVGLRRVEPGPADPSRSALARRAADRTDPRAEPPAPPGARTSPAPDPGFVSRPGVRQAEAVEQLRRALAEAAERREPPRREPREEAPPPARPAVVPPSPVIVLRSAGRRSGRGLVRSPLLRSHLRILR